MAAPLINWSDIETAYGTAGVSYTKELQRMLAPRHLTFNNKTREFTVLNSKDLSIKQFKDLLLPIENAFKKALSESNSEGGRIPEMTKKDLSGNYMFHLMSYVPPDVWMRELQGLASSSF